MHKYVGTSKHRAAREEDDYDSDESRDMLNAEIFGDPFAIADDAGTPRGAGDRKNDTSRSQSTSNSKTYGNRVVVSSQFKKDFAPTENRRVVFGAGHNIESGKEQNGSFGTKQNGKFEKELDTEFRAKDQNGFQCDNGRKAWAQWNDTSGHSFHRQDSEEPGIFDALPEEFRPSESETELIEQVKKNLEDLVGVKTEINSDKIPAGDNLIGFSTDFQPKEFRTDSPSSREKTKQVEKCHLVQRQVNESKPFAVPAGNGRVKRGNPSPSEVKKSSSLRADTYRDWSENPDNRQNEKPKTRNKMDFFENPFLNEKRSEEQFAKETISRAKQTNNVERKLPEYIDSSKSKYKSIRIKSTEMVVDTDGYPVTTRVKKSTSIHKDSDSVFFKNSDNGQDKNSVNPKARNKIDFFENCLQNGKRSDEKFAKKTTAGSEQNRNVEKKLHEYIERNPSESKYKNIRIKSTELSVDKDGQMNLTQEKVTVEENERYRSYETKTNVLKYPPKNCKDVRENPKCYHNLQKNVSNQNRINGQRKIKWVNELCLFKSGNANGPKGQNYNNQKRNYNRRANAGPFRANRPYNPYKPKYKPEMIHEKDNKHPNHECQDENTTLQNSSKDHDGCDSDIIFSFKYSNKKGFEMSYGCSNVREEKEALKENHSKSANIHDFHKTGAIPKTYHHPQTHNNSEYTRTKPNFPLSERNSSNQHQYYRQQRTVDKTSGKINQNGQVQTHEKEKSTYNGRNSIKPQQKYPNQEAQPMITKERNTSINVEPYGKVENKMNDGRNSINTQQRNPPAQSTKEGNASPNVTPYLKVRNNIGDENNSMQNQQCNPPEHTESRNAVVSRAPSPELERKKKLLIKYGRELSDLIIGCSWAKNIFHSFYHEWYEVRSRTIALFEELENSVSKIPAESRLKAICSVVSKGANVAAVIPDPRFKMIAGIVSTISNLISMMFAASPSLKTADVPVFEIVRCLQEDIEISSMAYIYALQCDQNFREACELLEQFHGDASDDKFNEMDDPFSEDFVGRIVAFNPQNLVVFCKRLQKCYERLLAANENGARDPQIRQAFLAGFEDYPEALSLIGQLHWRFDACADCFGSESGAQQGWEEVCWLLKAGGDSVDPKEVLPKVQECLLVLLKERRYVEHKMRELINLKNNESLFHFH